MKCDEIFAALAMLEKERGISQTFMMDKIVQALTTAYKRDHEGVENVVVDVDEGKRELKMFVQKEVVDEVENPGTQMSLDDAKAISAKYNVGDIVNIPVDNIEFGRIAAGNGKQVIIQGLREAESGMVYDEYNSKQHEILTGVVTRIDPRTGNASLRIGTGAEATDAILLAGEQVKGETLIEGQRIKVYLVDVRRQSRGPQVVISRTHPGLVKRLFELEPAAADIRAQRFLHGDLGLCIYRCSRFVNALSVDIYESRHHGSLRFFSRRKHISFCQYYIKSFFQIPVLSFPL